MYLFYSSIFFTNQHQENGFEEAKKIFWFVRIVFAMMSFELQYRISSYSLCIFLTQSAEFVCMYIVTVP